ncbi:efflux RND transporter periplasmic adaptor subunit [Bacterioplanoides pacificum]|uniref:Efflux RND transporter periplasmic adaptor subunit n=1 Tax=Bacterioplanoides pacificum TaxID=1171596 RepID=A0ABV7VUP1_9GAMM
MTPGNETTAGWLSSRLALPLLAVGGLLILIIAKTLAPGPEQQPPQEIAVSVALQPLTTSQLAPSVSGYGVVSAARQLHQVAEVAARILWVHPNLVAGAQFQQHEVLIRLDDTDYRLALAQAKAQQHIIAAQLQELNSNQKNLQALLQLSASKLQLARQELQRKQNLAQQQSLAASQLDAERQKLLNLQQEQQSLQQQLDTLPSRINSLKAQDQAAAASIALQQRNIERTSISMPFNGRIQQLDADPDAFKKQGQLLFSAIASDQVEVEAQFSLDKLRPFFALAFSSPQTPLPQSHNLQQALQQAGLSARISLPLTPDQSWQAEVVSVRESLTAGSHTLAVVLRVNQPYDGIIPGQRPPLLSGFPVRAELLASRRPLIAIPLSALHQHAQSAAAPTHTIYLAYPQSNHHHLSHRLLKQAITPALLTDNQALLLPQALADARQQDAQLVLNDLTPALDGMALQQAGEQ